MKKLLVIHGPNLNLLGSREPSTYGRDSLDDINQRLTQTGKAANLDVRTEQSNSESELIHLIQQAPKEKISHIIINPAAYTHTSVAIRDALLAVDIPFIEVHISNIHQREAFRAQSFFSDIAMGTISGLGTIGYDLALQAILNQS